MMSEQSRTEVVRIPGQGGSEVSEGPEGSELEGYEPKHRAAVVPPAGRLASQRKARAASSRTHVPVPITAVPAAPAVPHQVRRTYDTPVWVPEVHDEHDLAYVGLVPEADGAGVPARPEGMIRSARWTSSRGANVAAALLLVGFLAAAVASGSGLLRRQSTPTLALTLGCLLGAAGVYALLVVLRPVVVELAEQWLMVQRGTRQDRFNLASPFQAVQVSGRPGSRRWRLVLGSPDGRAVRVRHGMVDSRSLDVVVGYAQAIAAHERAARVERFNL
jgi:hypothetical protein